MDISGRYAMVTGSLVVPFSFARALIASLIIWAFVGVGPKAMVKTRSRLVPNRHAARPLSECDGAEEGWPKELQEDS